jgi:hypothetical protein
VLTLAAPVPRPAPFAKPRHMRPSGPRPPAASSRAMSHAGGARNKQPCSRLNCEGLSYPTRKPAVGASNTSAIKRGGHSRNAPVSQVWREWSPVFRRPTGPTIAACPIRDLDESRGLVQSPDKMRRLFVAATPASTHLTNGARSPAGAARGDARTDRCPAKSQGPSAPRRPEWQAAFAIARP